MSHTEQQNKFHRLLGKITRPRNHSKNRHQTKAGNAAESNPQTSSSAVNPTSTLDEPHEVSLPRSSVSTLVGDGKNPVDTPGSDIASKSASIHKALWEKAYSNLRNDKKKAEYVTTYEQVLSTVLLNQKIADQGLGEDQMKEIIVQGLKKIEKYKNAIDYSEDKLEAVKAIKSIIEIPLSNIPQTALPWAIISSTIDIFLKPLEVGAEFYNGVGYVVGRIEWYSRFTDQLLSQRSFRNESPLAKVRTDIEISITNLYQSLLFYQIKSVCCFYQRHQILVLVRGALRFDNWKGDLDDIKAAEKALRESCDFYSLECLKGQIREISMKHDIQEKVDTFRKRLQAIRHVDPKSIAGTIYKRKEMPIADLYEWIFETDVFKAFAKWKDENASRRLWISGQAGTGKTMLLLGTIKRIQADGLLQTGREEPPALIYFFCQSNDDQLNNGAAVLRSLVWMLLCQQPDLMKHLEETFSSSGDKFIYDRNSIDTWCEIMTNMLRDCGPIIILIDALDECEEVSRSPLASFLEEKLGEEELSHVKWLITSRPIWDLRHSRLSDNTPEKHSLLVLDDHNLSRWINAYISRKMVGIRDRAMNKNFVPTMEKQLCERASNTFIWASLVIREFEKSPEKNWKGILDRVPGDLHKLYDLLFEKLHDPDCKNVLAVAMLANRPLTLPEIEQLSGLESGINAGRDTVTLCGSFLTLRDETVYLIHQSAHDWLVERHYRLRNESLEELHAFIYDNSLKGLKEVLKQNVYDLPHFGVLTKEVKPPTDDPLSPIRYGCQYWVYHLKESKLVQPPGILEFLRAHFLHWLEAMALLGLLPEILQIVAELLLLQGPHSKSELSDFLLDSKRFIQKNLTVVTLAPLQLYVSALIFTPTDSLVRRTGSIPPWIERPPVVEKRWGCLLQTFELPHTVKSVAFSPNDQFLAGIDGQNIKIWDTATGVLKKELMHKHGNYIDLYGDLLHCIGFSSDGRNLVSTANSGEVQVWETETWRPTQKLAHIEPDILHHITVSPDSQMLASNFMDGIVKVWEKETDTWKLKWKFSLPIPSWDLSFSSNCLLLAASMSRWIVIWNLETGKMHHKIPQLANVFSIKFSRDSQFLYGGTQNGILVWETKDWSLKQEVKIARADNLPYYLYKIHAVSPDNKYIACSDADLLMVIETKSWTTFQTARGHVGPISAVTFSSDNQLMASGGSDRTIRLWDIVPGTFADDLDKHSTSIETLVYSRDGSFAATVTLQGEIKVWGVGTGALLYTIKNTMEKWFKNLAFSADNKMLAAGGLYGSVMVHDLETKKTVFQRHGTTSEEGNITEIQFSRNRRLVAATSSRPPRVEVWNTETGRLVKQKEQNLEGEELHDFIETWERKLHLDENTEFVDCNVSYEMPKPSPKFDISIVEDWIVLGQEKSIWLPPEHRPHEWQEHAWAQNMNSCVVGTQDGRALFFWFNPDAMSAKQLQTAK